MMNYLFNEFSVDHRSKQSNADQLFYYVVAKLISYQVIPGVALPHASHIASQLKMTTAEVQAAYDRLVAEKYFQIDGASVSLMVNHFNSLMALDQALQLEDLFACSGLESKIEVSKDATPALSLLVQEWMMLPKNVTKRELHRLHYGDGFPFLYSVVTMDPSFLPLNCEDCDRLDTLLLHWNNAADLQWTTPVLFSLVLPEELTLKFRLQQGTPAFAIRSSLLNNNGMMLATILYVVSPRMFFNTKTTLSRVHSSRTSKSQ